MPQNLYGWGEYSTCFGVVSEMSPLVKRNFLERLEGAALCLVATLKW